MSTGAIASDNPNVYRVPRPAQVNVELLEQSIRADLPVILSVSEHREGSDKFIDVGFANPPTTQHIATVDAVFAAHNPALKTPGQIKREARAAAQISVKTLVAKPNLNAQETETLAKNIAIALGLDNGD